MGISLEDIVFLVMHMDIEHWNVCIMVRKRFNTRFKFLRCSHYGQTAKYCHTIRLYVCDGFGHKAQNCRSSIGHSMNTIPYIAWNKSNNLWMKIRSDTMQHKKIHSYCWNIVTSKDILNVFYWCNPWEMLLFLRQGVAIEIGHHRVMR